MKNEIKDIVKDTISFVNSAFILPLAVGMDVLALCTENFSQLGEKIIKEGGRFSSSGALLRDISSVSKKTMDKLLNSDTLFTILLFALGISGSIGAGSAVMTATGFSFSAATLFSAKAALVIGTGIVAAPIAAGLAVFLMPLSVGVLYGAAKAPVTIYNICKNIPAEGALDMSPDAVLVRRFEKLSILEKGKALLAMKEKFPAEFKSAADKTEDFSFTPVLQDAIPYKGPLNMSKKKSFFSFK
jgi:hypothetical protein